MQKEVSWISQFPGGLWGLVGAYCVFMIGAIFFISWQSSQRRKKLEEKLETAQSDKALDYLGALFKLYNKQLAIYQNETRARAAHSFTWAVVSMMVGFLVLTVGGWRIVFGSTQNDVLSGGTLAAIGGALSAFITKTLLDVHKVSLIQLNRYFKQPVLNSHILTSKRLAEEEIKDETAKQRIFEYIIKEVIYYSRRSNSNQ